MNGPHKFTPNSCLPAGIALVETMLTTVVLGAGIAVMGHTWIGCLETTAEAEFLTRTTAATSSLLESHSLTASLRPPWSSEQAPGNTCDLGQVCSPLEFRKDAFTRATRVGRVAFFAVCADGTPGDLALRDPACDGSGVMWVKAAREARGQQVLSMELPLHP